MGCGLSARVPRRLRVRFFMKASPVSKISSSLKVGLCALRGRIHLICHTITLSPKEEKWTFAEPIALGQKRTTLPISSFPFLAGREFR